MVSSGRQSPSTRRRSPSSGQRSSVWRNASGISKLGWGSIRATHPGLRRPTCRARPSARLPGPVATVRFQSVIRPLIATDWCNGLSISGRRGRPCLPIGSVALRHWPGGHGIPSRHSWEEGFQHLEAFVAVHGTCKVPQALITQNRLTLGTWVSTKRTTRDTMSTNRTNRLEALPGWTWDVRPRKPLSTCRNPQGSDNPG